MSNRGGKRAPVKAFDVADSEGDASLKAGIDTGSVKECCGLTCCGVGCCNCKCWTLCGLLTIAIAALLVAVIVKILEVIVQGEESEFVPPPFLWLNISTNVAPLAAVGLSIQWELTGAHPSADDAIGLYHANATDNLANHTAGALWWYQTGGAPTGNLSSFPVLHEAGRYEFRFFGNFSESAATHHIVPAPQYVASGVLLSMQCGPRAGIYQSDGVADSYNAIKHVVLIVQENHSFDNIFGRYCTAATGTAPTCNTGPACCEQGPTTTPGSTEAVVMNDLLNRLRDPDHSQTCETIEMNGGLMDMFVTAACGSKLNFAYMDATTGKPYWDFAGAYAMSDNNFQSMIGASAGNSYYFGSALNNKFIDNEQRPWRAVGTQCNSGPSVNYVDPNLGDMFRSCGISWTAYAEGYDLMKSVADAYRADPDARRCPPAPRDCHIQFDIYPCSLDSSDVPFMYFEHLRDKPQYMQDLTRFDAAVAAHTLPQFSYIKYLGYHTEHPGYLSTISDGQEFVTKTVNAIKNSPAYYNNTLILMTYDEGGGYFDHVSPPSMIHIDGQQYGTRVPLMALGYFAKQNYISHVQTEHSSVVKFLESLFFNETGQLGGRDTYVNNLYDLLDPTKL